MSARFTVKGYRGQLIDVEAYNENLAKIVGTEMPKEKKEMQAIFYISQQKYD